MILANILSNQASTDEKTVIALVAIILMTTIFSVCVSLIKGERIKDILITDCTYEITNGLVLLSYFSIFLVICGYLYEYLMKIL